MRVPTQTRLQERVNLVRASVTTVPRQTRVENVNPGTNRI
jgi:hypothetical protein